MKIALLGNGRTGGKVHDVVSEDDQVTDFNESNLPTVDKLKNFDVVICFLPGGAFLKHYQTLLDSGAPVVTGSTGFTWPENANEQIQSGGVAWITADNFSLGMQLVHDAITTLGEGLPVIDDANISIHEIHHVHKKDKPSGTALKWQEWLGAEASISSQRTGDVVGDHKLIIDTPNETISIHHIAKDRKIFAAGAVWAAKKITELEPGLHKFEDVVAKFKLKEK